MEQSQANLFEKREGSLSTSLIADALSQGYTHCYTPTRRGWLVADSYHKDLDVFRMHEGIEANGTDGVRILLIDAPVKGYFLERFSIPAFLRVTQ